MDIDKLVVEATNGSKTALEGITVAIQDDVYHLALRFLVNPENGKDATQDILIKVITNMSSFRFESKFKTWVYRLAVNYLISEKKVRDKDLGLTFDLYKIDLESDLTNAGELKNDPEYQVLLNELRISCTMAMLLFLNLPHRMAYILGDILEMRHEEASNILQISKQNFRKQLSRARAKVIEFTSESCGLINKCAKCHCEKKITGAIERKRVRPDNIFYSGNGQYSYAEIKDLLLETRKSMKNLTLQKSIKAYNCPDELSNIIDSLVVEGIKVNQCLH